MIRQIFCKHKYLTHAKEKYEWREVVIHPYTKYWARPIIEKQDFSEINEVLICEKCGSIKVITY